MKIMFIDPMMRDYDTRTPTQEALGGTQSAVAYLSGELARLGNEVTVVNGVAEPREVDGVRFTHLPCTTEEINSHDVVVAVASAMGQRIRQVGVTRPMVMWCHHATNQGAVAPLADPQERAMFQGYAMVSQWQAQTYMSAFQVPADQIRIMRNSVAPYFLSVQPGVPWYRRGGGPVLAYTSTPFRGLDVLLMAFPLIRARVPDATLKVFSGMGIYGAGEDDFRSLYELCNALPGVEYVGPQPQAQLARAMAEVDFLAYPSTFAETSCIAAMEAMAAGARVATTPLGALPETTNGFALMIEQDAPLPPMFASRYANAVADAILGVDPNEADSRRAQQIAFARGNYNWTVRAREWHDWLLQLAQQ